MVFVPIITIGAENPVEASDKSPNKSPLYVNTPPQVPSTPITPASVAMNPANKITMPFPVRKQPPLHYILTLP